MGEVYVAFSKNGEIFNIYLYRVKTTGNSSTFLTVTDREKLLQTKIELFEVEDICTSILWIPVRRRILKVQLHHIHTYTDMDVLFHSAQKSINMFRTS